MVKYLKIIDFFVSILTVWVPIPTNRDVCSYILGRHAIRIGMIRILTFWAAASLVTLHKKKYCCQCVVVLYYAVLQCKPYVSGAISPTNREAVEILRH